MLEEKDDYGGDMHLKKISILFAVLFFVVLSSIVCADSGVTVKKDGQPFPSFGSGKILVRLYTDYFCSPCRAMEPKIEPVLTELVKKNIINLTFVDTPIHKSSSLYARYFLYILNEKNEFEFALLARSVLIGASLEKISDTTKLEAYLKGKGIRFKAFDIKPIIDIFNGYFNNDKINSTPICVISQGGKIERYSGGPEILSALERLEQKTPKKPQ